MKQAEGKEILRQLIERADVFHVNFPESVVAKLGLGYAELKKHNPRLIYGRTTAFGSRGPLRERRGYDTLAQAMSGAMWAMGDRDFDEPVGIVGSPFDQLAATMMAFGIICALLGRERGGEGQEVQVSLLGSALHLQKQNVNMTLIRGRPNARFVRRKSANPMSNNYRCADGKWLMLAEPMSDLYWAEFCAALGIPQIKDDPRFAVHLGGRSKNNVELIQILDGVFATRKRDEWIKIFEENGVRFGYAPVYDLAEAVQNPQVSANDYTVDFDHDVWGKVKMAGFPAWFSATPAFPRRPAPEHGQHTEEVLIDVLGYDWEQISRLKEAGVV
ncbi:MAG: CoA transferase [Chloroflexota bacterium]